MSDRSGRPIPLPPQWGELVGSVIQSCRSGPAAISIQARPSSASNRVLDEVDERLRGDFEHIVRIDGMVLGCAERSLRSWLDESEISVSTDAFSTVRELLEKNHYVLFLIDHATRSLLAHVTPRALGGAIVATVPSTTPPLGEHYELPEYPAELGWAAIRDRSTEVISVQSAALTPESAAIDGLARLPGTTLQRLVAELEDRSDGDDATIGLRDVLMDELQRCTPAERETLAYLAMYGPGRISVAAMGPTLAHNRHVVDRADLEKAVDAIAAVGIIGRDGDDVDVPWAVTAAIGGRREIDRRQRRRVLHAVVELKNGRDDLHGDRLDLALRLSSWCHEHGFQSPEVARFRRALIERLVDEQLLIAAVAELDAAIVLAREAHDRREEGHLLVDRGLVLRFLRRTGQALLSLEEALTAFGTLRNADREMAMTISNVGMIQQQSGMHREAVNSLDRARSVLSRVAEDTAIEDINISISLSVSLLHLRQTARAHAEIGAIERQLERRSPSDPAIQQAHRDLAPLRRSLALLQSRTELG